MLGNFLFLQEKHKVLTFLGKQEFEIQHIGSKSYWGFILFSHTFRQIQKTMPYRQVEDFPRKLLQTLPQLAALMMRVRIVLGLLITTVATM